MREGTLQRLAPRALKAIVTFPSFHAAMAVLLTYPYRKFTAAFPLVIFWNGLMLVSVPKHGSHYFVDVLAGAAVAVLSIYLVREVQAGRGIVPVRARLWWAWAVRPVQRG